MIKKILNFLPPNQQSSSNKNNFNSQKSKNTNTGISASKQNESANSPSDDNTIRVASNSNTLDIKLAEDSGKLLKLILEPNNFSTADALGLINSKHSEFKENTLNRKNLNVSTEAYKQTKLNQQENQTTRDIANQIMESLPDGKVSKLLKLINTLPPETSSKLFTEKGNNLVQVIAGIPKNILTESDSITLISTLNPQADSSLITHHNDSHISALELASANQKSELTEYMLDQIEADTNHSSHHKTLNLVKGLKAALRHPSNNKVIEVYANKLKPDLDLETLGSNNTLTHIISASNSDNNIKTFLDTSNKMHRQELVSSLNTKNEFGLDPAQIYVASRNTDELALNKDILFKLTLYKQDDSSTIDSIKNTDDQPKELNLSKSIKIHNERLNKTPKLDYKPNLKPESTLKNDISTFSIDEASTLIAKKRSGISANKIKLINYDLKSRLADLTDINKLNSQNYSLLEQGVIHKDSEALTLVVDAMNANLNSKNASTDTKSAYLTNVYNSLGKALDNKDSESFKFIVNNIENKNDLLSIKDSSGNTLLHLIAKHENSDPQMISGLISDIDAKSALTLENDTGTNTLDLLARHGKVTALDAALKASGLKNELSENNKLSAGIVDNALENPNNMKMSTYLAKVIPADLKLDSVSTSEKFTQSLSDNNLKAYLDSAREHQAENLANSLENMDTIYLKNKNNHQALVDESILLKLHIYRNPEAKLSITANDTKKQIALDQANNLTEINLASLEISKERF
jgi:hypothetical protein